MKATVLVDNLTRNTLQPEWGLSIYIEYKGHRILLDTGTTDLFYQNAQSLGIDLASVDFGVLSHAHYDHADGMETFFVHNKKAPFYLRKGSRENCYSKKDGTLKYIGIRRGYLEQYRDRIIYADDDYEVIPNVWLLPHRTDGLEALAYRAKLYVEQEGKLIPDTFCHEQSLVFDTEDGLVIFNSCSHGGADNIIREVSSTFPGRKIHALIGGFHLFVADDEAVYQLARRIKETSIEKIYTGHCTGQSAMEILKEELGDMAEQLYTGMEIAL